MRKEKVNFINKKQKTEIHPYSGLLYYLCVIYVRVSIVLSKPVQTENTVESLSKRP